MKSPFPGYGLAPCTGAPRLAKILGGSLSQENSAMESNGVTKQRPIHGRRWCQYSLRLLMLFVTLCAIACGWLGVKVDRGRKQKAVVDALEKRCFRISYDYETDDMGNLVPNPRLKVPQFLRRLMGDDCFTNVVEVEAYNPSVRLYLDGLDEVSYLPLARKAMPESLRLVAQLPHIKKLHLEREEMDDSRLDQLQCLSDLECLSLNGAMVSNSGLAKLRAFPKLRSLELGYTLVTDEGMATLACLNRLEVLRLDGTDVSDTGLAVLQNIKNLKCLSLQDMPSSSRVSGEGIARFKEALPNCKLRADALKRPSAVATSGSR
jgi:hypothetical protein